MLLVADAKNEETADSRELATNELVGITWPLLVADANKEATADSNALVGTADGKPELRRDDTRDAAEPVDEGSSEVNNEEAADSNELIGTVVGNAELRIDDARDAAEPVERVCSDDNPDVGNNSPVEVGAPMNTEDNIDKTLDSTGVVAEGVGRMSVTEEVCTEVGCTCVKKEDKAVSWEIMLEGATRDEVGRRSEVKLLIKDDADCAGRDVSLWSKIEDNFD